MKIMVDKNVILDVLQKREPFFINSYKAIHDALSQKADCLVSASAITDIFYILNKALHSTDVARKCIEDLSKIMTFTDVLSCDINSALISGIEDFEDAVVDAVAERVGADFILTRNYKDFSGAKTRVIAPETYVQS